MSTPIILLAAGSSSRLGQPKQLLIYQGQTLLRRAAETAVTAAAGAPVVVVTGALHEELLLELAGLPVEVVRCAAWELGMGASLKVGLKRLEELQQPLRAVAVMLCDQPFVTPTLLHQLAETHHRTHQPIVAAEYAAIRGVPVFFGADALPLLVELPNAAGAGQLLKRHAELVATVPFPEGSTDVDTPEQYAALLAR